jgi:hypothetical protein
MELQFEPNNFNHNISAYRLLNSKRGLWYNQIQGYRNASAPQELKDKVQAVLDDFNNYELPSIKLEPHAKLQKQYQTHDLWEVNELPF